MLESPSKTVVQYPYQGVVAEPDGLVARMRQVFCQGLEVFVEGITRLKGVVSGRIFPAEHRSMGRDRPLSRGYRFLKKGAGLSEVIQVWGRSAPIPVAAQPVYPVGIENDENDIRLLFTHE
jgi:hypothetical protein